MKKRITACAAALAAAAAFGDVAWTNDMAILTFGWSGAVKSLVERETGRELVKPGSFVFMSVGDRLLYPSKFENAGGDGRSAFRSVDSSLRARSWLPAGNEGSPLIGGSGDMYFNRREKRLLWVTFDDDGRGAFYSRSLNSRGDMPRSL